MRDLRHLEMLGTWDAVYSWGVLHHTGEMWSAMAHGDTLVAPRGRLFVAVYNDQGRTSQIWRTLKRTSHLLPPPLRPGFVLLVMGPREALAAAVEIAHLRPMAYLRR